MMLEGVTYAYHQGIYTIIGKGMVVGHVELKARQLATCTESEGVRTLVGVLITHSGREHAVVAVLQTTRKQGLASIFRGEITTRKWADFGVCPYR